MRYFWTAPRIMLRPQNLICKQCMPNYIRPQFLYMLTYNLSDDVTTVLE